jgi:hypothetical protein
VIVGKSVTAKKAKDSTESSGTIVEDDDVKGMQQLFTESKLRKLW